MILRPLYRFIERRMGYVQPNDGRTQDQLLSDLLKNAARSVPYYRDVLHDTGVISNGKVDLKKFTAIPPLTKDRIRTQGTRMIAQDIDTKKTVWNTSGGSTGEPVRLLQDANYLRSARRATYDQEQMTGYVLGDPIVKLWGDERELLKGSQTLKARIFNVIKHQTFMNAFLMNTEHMQSYIQRLNTLRPTLLIAYAQALYELARFAESQQKRIEGPQAIMTSAGTLYPFMREQIEKVTGKRVFNRYGSREVGNIACECEVHEGMHIAWQHVLVEIVDEKMQPCLPGVEGEILVTSLANYAMPLIRYRIGDYGMLKENHCACGRPGPMLENVVGRVTDAFRTLSGKVVPAEYFIHIIGVVLNRGAIRKFQVIQEAEDRIRVKVVAGDAFNTDDEHEITEKIQAVMEGGCAVLIERVSDIAVLPSGKYRYTIREIP